MPLDPNKKRDSEFTLAQRLGATASQATTGLRTVRDNVLFRPVRAIAGDDPLASAGKAVSDFGASYSAGRPTQAPPRNTAVHAAPGGGAAPTGGVPSSPAPVVKPDFSGARGTVTGPRETGIQRSVVNGVPTYTGTGAFAPTKATAPVVQGVQRPTFTNPSIPLVGSPGVVSQTEDRDQREARQAALSNIDTQLFLNRGKTTRSARDLTAGLLQTQADLTNTAGNQAVALKAGNLDNQTRLDITALQNQGENDRAAVNQVGENQRVSLLDAGATERERIKLEHPSLLTDRDGGYHLVNPMQGIARPVLSNGQQVRGLVEGSITPVDRLVSLQEEHSRHRRSRCLPSLSASVSSSVRSIRCADRVPLSVT